MLLISAISVTDRGCTTPIPNSLFKRRCLIAIASLDLKVRIVFYKGSNKAWATRFLAEAELHCWCFSSSARSCWNYCNQLVLMLAFLLGFSENQDTPDEVSEASTTSFDVVVVPWKKASYVSLDCVNGDHWTGHVQSCQRHFQSHDF